MRRQTTIAILTSVLAITALSLLYSFQYVSFGGFKDITTEWTHSSDQVEIKSFTTNYNTTYPTIAVSSAQYAPSTTSSPPVAIPGLRKGNDTLLQIAPGYIKAIMSLGNGTYPRLQCPAPDLDRYDVLRSSSGSQSRSVRPKFFFALDLHQCVSILPSLLGAVVESMRFLGPENCALSIVEGRSNDGTFEVLKLLRSEIEGIGATYFFDTNPINPMGPNGFGRIGALAQLRNQALAPLVKSPNEYASDTSIIFLNDIAICMEDILELIFQRVLQDADMTCAMDWIYLGPDPTFYDVWISRGSNGDSFFKIPESGSWDYAWDLFWNDPSSKRKLMNGDPFQVFSCWNGATVFTAKPVMEKKIRFRGSYKDECFQGEPQLFCKEMWYNGYGRIAVVPSVNVGYSRTTARKLKDSLGYVHDYLSGQDEGEVYKIEWNAEPPLEIKCIPDFQHQKWVPWNQALAAHSRPHPSPP